MRLSRTQRQMLAALVAALVLGLWWWAGSGSSDDTDRPDPRPSASDGVRPDPEATAGGTDPDSGLPWVAESALPREARETLELIDAGGPFPERQDGSVFENRERILPRHDRGYYHEYTVPTPGSDDRGARRVVTGDEGEYYWTEDHYASFERIAR